MAGSVGGEKREGRGSNPRPPTAHRSPLRRPGESTILSAYVACRMYLIMAVTGLGYLALTWSTVVLLGGFVTALQNKDFWCLTTISMLQAASIFNDLRDRLFIKLLKLILPGPTVNIGTYLSEWFDILKRNKSEFYETSYRSLRSLLSSHCCLAFVLAGPVFVLLVLFFIIIFPLYCLLCVAFYFVMSVYGFLGPIACFALALWRILQPDYGDTDGDASKGNLKPALIMFYWLILCQFVLYLVFIITNGFVEFVLVPLVSRDSKLTQVWGTKSVNMYLSDTGAKCWREKDPASISGRSLSRYAAYLLDSESWEDNLFGARMLATFIRHGADVRSLLLPSRPKIQKLIDTLAWKGRGDREMRECAAGIVAHLAGDIHIGQFPGALRCISSLLQLQDETTATTYWDSDGQQVGDDGAMSVLDLLQKYLHWVSYDQQVGDDGGKKDGGCNKLILQGLAILERLASSDHHNCSDICSAPGLLHMITAPLYSGTFSGDINMSDWAHVVNAAFKVIYQLISHAPEDISTRLRLDISSNEQAMSNLKGILDQGTGIGLETQEQLLMRAMEILTELTLDSSVDLTSETKENLIKKQLQIFLADQATQEPDSRTNPLIVTAGRTLVLLTSNSKTNPDFILKACDSDSLAPLTGLPDDENTVALPIEVTIEDKKNTVAHLTELLDATNNITYRTIAAEILENFCTHCDWNKHKQIMKELLLPKVVTEILSIKSDQPEGKISDEKENKPQSRTWTRSQKNNRGNQKNFVPPGKDEENQKDIAPGGKSMIRRKSSDEQNKQNKEQTAKKELQEALLSLALVICDKLISADDVIQEKALGGDAFVVKLKTIIDDNCQLRADSLRIVKLCGRIAASMMQSQPYAERFRNKKFAQSLTKASEIMSNLESCMIFAGTDFGLKKTVRPLLSELEKKVSDLEKKEVQLVRR
ncbi:hypothetical protein SEVIR_8G068000v4 [Setaria viridis]|uniref:Uncharacterized protein n=1 Tax=Setaria viridis TaxID=4556 RepID=A0A4U6TQI4_SETVI|nr:uncharacterized protein LOC117866453 [Setaria viridis]TKV99806.1 hypothetical protein SEVIR_8G068000v2 [Setaria viridis]